MNPEKGSVAWSMLSLFYMALQQLESSRAMVVITALGIIQLNAPSVPSSVHPPFSFLCPQLSLWRRPGLEGSESSLGWVFHDPVIRLDMQPVGWEHGRQ